MAPTIDPGRDFASVAPRNTGFGMPEQMGLIFALGFDKMCFDFVIMGVA